jgi:hypothetical protein
MTSNLELIHDPNTGRLITMSENNSKLLTVATGRDDNGNWVIVSRNRYNEIKQHNEKHGNILLHELLRNR